MSALKHRRIKEDLKFSQTYNP